MNVHLLSNVGLKCAFIASCWVTWNRNVAPFGVGKGISQVRLGEDEP